MKTEKDKQELVQLILKNDPSQKKEEVEGMVDGLTDDQFVALLSLFSDIKSYEDGMDNYLKKYAPDEYSRLIEKHNNEIAEVRADSNRKYYEASTKFDEELDDLEKEETQILENSIKPYEELADIYEEIAQELEKASNTPN